MLLKISTKLFYLVVGHQSKIENHLSPSVSTIFYHDESSMVTGSINLNLVNDPIEALTGECWKLILQRFRKSESFKYHRQVLRGNDLLLFDNHAVCDRHPCSE